MLAAHRALTVTVILFGDHTIGLNKHRAVYLFLLNSGRVLASCLVGKANQQYPQTHNALQYPTLPVYQENWDSPWLLFMAIYENIESFILSIIKTDRINLHICHPWLQSMFFINYVRIVNIYNKISFSE